MERVPSAVGIVRPASLATTHHRARPLIAYMLALAATMTVPALMLAGVTISRWVASEQGRLQGETREATDRAVSQVDRYLAGKIAMLQALATSPAVEAGDFPRLDAQARELLDLQGLNIVMRDLDGQQRVNTRVPWGAPLPRVPNTEADREVVATRAPVIANLYMGVMANGPLIRVVVPVIRGGEIRYTLTASLSPEGLARILGPGGAGIGIPYFASIADRDGRILARADDNRELVGAPLPGFARAVGDVGSWSGVNPVGVAVYASYRRSALSGWLFAVGVDQSVVDAPLYKSMLGLGLLAVALGLAAFGISSIIVRRIVGSHRQIVAAAEALDVGRLVEPPETCLRETNLVGRALADASTRLRGQAAALVEANHDLEHRVEERTSEVSAQAVLLAATLDNMDQGLMLIDADGMVPICNQRAIDLLDLPEALMRSRPTFEAVRRHQLGTGEFTRAGEPMRRWVESGGLEQTHHSYERERPDGTVLEIRSVPLAAGGAVRTYTDITARKTSERLSHHMARHDSLTDLPNRTLLRERLAEQLDGIRREGGSVAVLCIDLDRFKVVNDTLGHPAGDALLRIAAGRIRQVAGPGDLLARLGGDEFAIIQVGAAQPRAAADLAAATIEALRAPFTLDGHVVNVGASIGIAIAPQDGDDADHIFKSADLALYGAKNGGRGTFRFYEAAMVEAIEARQALELDLRLAVARGEFELHYQPLVRIEDRSIAGFEALLRWRHPERGLVGPDAFVPLLEDTRLIVPVGAWVLREACRTALGWPQHIRVQVNLSGIQIEDQGLAGYVLGALGTSGLSPQRLQLEITETVLMHESEAVRASLQALRQFGVKIVLDDFGTGYSSLGYLQHFTLDGIKIDKSFVAGRGNPTVAAVFAAVAGLGKALGVSVTAEGIETPEQLDYVRRSGCAEAQGFLFSRPVPAAEALRLATSATLRDDLISAEAA